MDATAHDLGIDIDAGAEVWKMVEEIDQIEGIEKYSHS